MEKADKAKKERSVDRQGLRELVERLEDGQMLVVALEREEGEDA